jgi:hypothetical protein
MNSKFVIVAFLAVVLVLVSCGSEDTNPVRVSDGDTSGDNGNGGDDRAVVSVSGGKPLIWPEGYAWPVDAMALDDGTLLVLFSAGPEDADLIEALVWYDASFEPLWIFTPGFAFAHTIDVKNGQVLISDTMNGRLIVVGLGDTDHEVIEIQGYDSLIAPNDADFTDDGNILFSDILSQTAFKISLSGEVIWARDFSYLGTNELHDPDELPNGNLLFCLSISNEVLEVNENDEVVWNYDKELATPKSVQRLANGNTVITNLDQIVEVNAAGETVWSYYLGYGGMNAQRLENGNTLNGTNWVGLIAPDGSVIWELLPPMTPKKKQSRAANITHKRLIMRSIGYL